MTDPRASAGRPQRRSLAREIHSEAVLVLGWPRAILMQIAHPLVAAGVAEHTTFRGGIGERFQRLHDTVEAMLAFNYGRPEEVQRTAACINAIHDRVHGRLRQAVGPFPVGTPYSAHDPELLRWVHVTLLDSTLLLYELLFRPLSPELKDRYCLETSGLAPLLGIPKGYLPVTLAEMRAYMGWMMASQIAVGETARGLARELLRPPLPGPGAPLSWPYVLQTIGLLPPELREAYGFRWGPVHQALLGQLLRLARVTLRAVPPAVRRWPRARAALAAAH